MTDAAMPSRRPDDVDLEDAILLARTHEVADMDYEHNREVLDAVIAEMSLRPPGAK